MGLDGQVADLSSYSHRSEVFLKADTSWFPQPLLCVILDTEEEFDWGGPFSRLHVSVDSIPCISRGQEIFRRYGLQPAYLIDYPVASDARAADLLGPWLEAGECLVGAQLHPWVTPPFEEVVCPYNSYPCNLELDLERRKLGALTAQIQRRFGTSPLIYKAGRYGLGIGRESMLVELGYQVDTSVMPYRDFAGLGGGPNFFGYPDGPFWTSPERRLFYLPVDQSLVGPLRSVGQGGLGEFIFGRLSSRLHLPGILARFRLLERIMLTPEGVSLAELCRLVDCRLRAGQRIFALSLHSPSFMPGGTPYVRDTSELEDLIRKINEFLAYFFGRLNGRCTNPIMLRQILYDKSLPICA